MDSESTRPNPGGTLAIADIVGRDHAVDSWLKALRSTSGLLSEPRRLGKTQALRLVKARAPRDEWTVITASFQAVTTLEEMAATAIGSILNVVGISTKLGQFIRSVRSAVGELGFTLNDGTSFSLSPVYREDPLGAVQRVLRAAAKDCSDGRLVLLAWDEVPDMISAIAEHEGRPKAVRLLRMLRTWREDELIQSGVRWIITGSVGLHHVVRQLGITVDVTNDLRPLRLGPLERDAAAVVARRTLRGAGVREPSIEAVDRLSSLSDGIPFVIHLVAAAVESRSVTTITPSQIEAIFTEVLRDLDDSKQLTPLLTRVANAYGEDAELAESLLDFTCTGHRTYTELVDRGDASLGASARDVERVIDFLVLDHYLVVGKVYEWRYDVLRRFWAIRTMNRRER